MALINLRNAMMAGKRLPYDAEVEYLESTGTQWIDTGVTPDFNLSMSATLCKTDTSVGFLFGARQANANNSFCLASFSTYARFDFGGAGGNQGQTNISPICDGNLHTISVAYPTITLDGASNKMASVPSFSLNQNIVLFANNTNGSITKYSGVRIAALKLYFNGVLVRDYIPVRKGTVGYLYDRVSGKLFGNAGTGDFVLGPDVVPVEWLGSTGTQYIDSGVMLNSNHVVKLRGLRDSTTGGGYANSFFGANIGFNVVFNLTGSVGVERFYFFESPSPKESQIATNTFKEYECGKNFIIDGTPIGTTSSATGSTTADAYIFARNNGTAAKDFIRGKIAYLQIWLNTDLVRDFIPVRVGTGSTWEGAMMDVLTRKVYRNQGTGAFTYGNDLKYPIPAE